MEQSDEKIRQEAFDDFMQAVKEEARKGQKGEESIVELVMYLQAKMDELKKSELK